MPQLINAAATTAESGPVVLPGFPLFSPTRQQEPGVISWIAYRSEDLGLIIRKEDLKLEKEYFLVNQIGAGGQNILNIKRNVPWGDEGYIQ